jgi:hypothetical protein
MKITYSTNQIDITIPLDLAGCMVPLKHRLPTQEEFTSLKQYYLTQGDTPWNSSSFSHQVADKYDKQVIDTDFNNANTLTLFPYDPADMHKQSLLGKPAKLIFIPNSVMKTQVNHLVPMNADPHNRFDLGDHDDKAED